MIKGQYYTNEEDVFQKLYFKKDPILAEDPHFHDSIELICLIEGQIEAYIDGKKATLNAGDICFVESYETHCYIKKSNKLLAYVIVISRDYLRMFRETYSGYTFNNFLCDKEKNKNIFSFLDYWFSNLRSAFLFNSGMVSTLLALFAETYPLVERHDYSGDIVIKEILHYIHLHFTEDISLKTISKEFGYTVEYCSKIISKATKCNFRTYLNLLRLRKANELLADKSFGYTAQEALYKAGFSSPATYYRIKNELEGK